MNDLIAPYGGELVNLFADETRIAELKEAALSMPSWDVTTRQQADLDLLMNGAYSPLRGFMGRKDYEQVLGEMRLADGTLWPLPVTLDVSEALGDKLAPGQSLALRDLEGVLLAVLHIDDVWRPDRAAEALVLYGSSDPHHPGVAQFLAGTQPVYVGGRVEGVEAVMHHSFTDLRYSPAELRAPVRQARLGAGGGLSQQRAAACRAARAERAGGAGSGGQSAAPSRGRRGG